MKLIIGAVVGVLTAGGLAHAQYPSRGNPEPGFFGGRPKIVATTEASTGLDWAERIVALSGTRFAIVGSRPNDARDFVGIIDTVPERVTTFDTQFAADSQWESLGALAIVDSTLYLTGARLRPDGTLVAMLQARDIGVDPNPAFAARGSVESPSTNPSRPKLWSHTVAIKAMGGGLTQVWQARSEFTSSYDCGATILHRLDHQSGAFVERSKLDLAAVLGQTCLVAYYSLPVERRPSDPPNAQAVLVGASCRLAPSDVVYVCIARVVDIGGTLSIDRTFGSNGIYTHGAATRMNWLLQDLKADAAGNVVIPIDRATGDPPITSLAPIAIRLRPDGALDNSFSSGTLSIPVGTEGHVGGVAVTPKGTLQLVGSGSGPTGIRPYIYYYDPASGASQLSRLEFAGNEPNYSAASFNGVIALAAGGALAVGGVNSSATTGHTLIARLAGDRQTLDLLEYYHAGFNHYFVASVPGEIQKLDDGTFVGWQRTGQSFAALPLGASGAADVCRFFSETFAPRSSHFYTPLIDECNTLKAGNVWSYEGLVFALQTPSGTGLCPPGTNPLYRLYNNGEGNAPNHRLTGSDTLRSEQVSRGWIGEGSGSPPVFACGPG